MKYLVLALGALALPAFAQDLDYSNEPILECLRADKRAECMGLASAACVENTLGGDTSIIMAACSGKELEFWGMFVKSLYANLDINTQQDIEFAACADKGERKDILKCLHSDWERYRDGICQMHMLSFPEGAARNFEYIDCLRMETSKHALVLGKILDEQ